MFRLLYAWYRDTEKKRQIVASFLLVLHFWRNNFEIYDYIMLSVFTLIPIMTRFLYYKLNYHDQKIWQILACDMRNHWTAVSTLLCFISSVYTVISLTGDWTSDHKMQSWNSTTELLVHMTRKWCQIAGFFGHSNSINDIMPLLKKENVHRFLYVWKSMGNNAGSRFFFNLNFLFQQRRVRHILVDKIVSQSLAHRHDSRMPIKKRPHGTFFKLLH